MKKPMFCSSTFFPKPCENKMKNVGNVLSAREFFLLNKPSNLNFLLEKRFLWMNDFINDKWLGIEVGCGSGLSRLFIKSTNFKLTDISAYGWVEQYVDALNMPFSNSSLDFIVSSNMIHHLAKPKFFFDECSRVLKKDGLLIIQEINASLMMRIILKTMRHEGFSYDINVFDSSSICNDPADAWSANCALPNLLFDNKALFEQHFSFKIIFHQYSEFLIFLLSGGVIAKAKTINLPRLVLKFIDKIDEGLIFGFKSVFPLQRKIVLRNVKM